MPTLNLLFSQQYIEIGMIIFYFTFKNNVVQHDYITYPEQNAT